MTPLDIASNLQALINLSKEVPFSRIPDHIEEKKETPKLHEQIRNRHKDIKNLEKRNETLEMATSLANDRHDTALRVKR